jgi:hypothetical protein
MAIISIENNGNHFSIVVTDWSRDRWVLTSDMLLKKTHLVFFVKFIRLSKKEEENKAFLL